MPFFNKEMITIKKLLLIFTLIILTGCSIDIKKFVDQIEEISSSFEESDYNVDSFNLTNKCALDSNMPSSGTINPLIMPIMLEDGNDSLRYQTSAINDLFFSNDLEWESLKSYYYKSSYKALNINGNVLNYQSLQHSNSYYLSYENSSYKKPNDIILEEVISNLNIDFKNYDSDNDKIIDLVYLIYNTSNDNFKSSYHKFNLKYNDYYIKEYITLNISDMYSDNYLDPTTLIVNTSYMLGLPDLTGNEKTDGVGSFDILTGAKTDYNPFSKLLLGWAKPTVMVRGENYISLNPYETTGEILILNASYSRLNNIYDEYFIIDFFTNKEINRITELTETGGGYAISELENGKTVYKEAMGIRIYHVNSKLKENKKEFEYNNYNTNYSLLSLLNGNSFLYPSDNVEYNVLYNSNKLLSISNINSNELVNPYNKKWDISIESMTDTECLLRVIYNK